MDSTLKYQAIIGTTESCAPMVTARLSATKTGNLFLRPVLMAGAIYRSPAVAPKDSWKLIS